MAPKAESPPTTTTLQDVPDKIIYRILRLVIASPLCLVRAAATCKRWRRLVADRHFRPAGCRRPHPVAGSYHNDRRRGGLVFVPTPSSPVDGRYFSLDFLPDGSGSWEVVDSRGSVLLLAKKKKAGWRRRCFPDLLVCEPLKRRYRLIPPMEEMRRHRCLGVFLKAFGDARTGWGLNGAYIPTFEVICVLYRAHDGVRDDVGTAVACVFDSFHRYYRGIAMHWRAIKGGASAPVLLRGTETESLRFLGRTANYLFWSIEDDQKHLLKLSAHGGFRLHWLPDFARSSILRVTDHDSSEYAKMRVICLQGSELQLFVASWHLDDEEWLIQRSLGLMEATRGLTGYKEEYFRGGGALKFVTADMRSVVQAPAAAAETWLFSVDLDTMEVMRCMHRANDHASVVAYTPCELPWPPDLRACKVRCSRNGRGPCADICICHCADICICH